MIALLGLAVTLFMVFGGYVLAGGKLGIVLKALPFEGMMIGGAAVGAFLAKTRHVMTRERAKKLATVYGSMEPSLAAKTISALTVEKSSMVVAEMAPSVAGPILAEMPQSKSRQIADYLLQDQ